MIPTVHSCFGLEMATSHVFEGQQEQDLVHSSRRPSLWECPAFAGQPLAVMLGFGEGLRSHRERVSVRHHVFVEELHLDTVLSVERQLRVNALPALDERPEPFSRTGSAAGALQAVGVSWGHTTASRRP